MRFPARYPRGAPEGPPVAIVTGAASGIGAAIAARLVRQGCAVTLVDVDARALQRTATVLGAPASVLDVADAAALPPLFRDVRERHGRLDYVVNNAGIFVAGRAETLADEHWDRTLAVNLRGAVHGTRAAYPIMAAQGHGHIVNIASMAGLVPVPFMLPYATAKHAVVGLSLALRAEAARHGVRVSAVCPGFVDSPMLGRANAGLPRTGMEDGWPGIARRFQFGPYPVDRLAADILAGIARNRAVIVAPARVKLLWQLYRLAPVWTARALAGSHHLMPTGGPREHVTPSAGRAR
ncbi:SDR family NAD(P)-dependent oxidoreductase [Actinomadura rupiterrae]|uniref:SDR family NAD(P)-dependent oxidoreductase n=1 Tax=Actinomadura rupiterrae TaxID=559627 RepID=UPI0020A3EBBF|nr:SDR family oxidoreductase [Actinomadura rupiterrae]MCP2337418.1 NAD(P)-dependent dehydrogenase (short-subunit alcohol dehydrogenase family) [Actinomadura rupiterrae]